LYSWVGVAVVESSAMVGSGSAMADGHAEQVHAEHGGQEVSLYVLFVAVLLGSACLQLQSTTVLHAIPFSVLIFSIGILFAFADDLGAFAELGLVQKSLDIWLDMDPHLLLFVFLPPLLFADAMSIDTHMARKTIGQCLILAGPGVVIGAVATAAVVYYIPFGFDMWTSLAVGAILAATDPVAVVGLLKDLGASPILTLQIQGESLLNDGTSVVLFKIAYDIVSGEVYGPKRVLVYLVTSTVGASLFGAATGIFFFKWIKSSNDKLNHNSAIVQISLTIACAYLSFLVSEGVFGMSGVLSTVVCGVVLADKVWPVLVHREAVHQIWHFIETIGNILVFFLAGAVFGHTISAFRGPSMQDYCWLLVLYVAVTLIRFILITCLRPFMNMAGKEKVSMIDVLVMTWGGLRGMVGLALALLVQKDLAKGHLDQEAGDRILFLVGGIAALTLIVNATTAPFLCDALGVTQSPQDRQLLLNNVAQRAAGHIDGLVDKLADKQQAGRLCRLGVVREALANLQKEIHHGSTDSPSMQSLDSLTVLRNRANRSTQQSSFSAAAHPCDGDATRLPEVMRQTERLDVGSVVRDTEQTSGSKTTPQGSSERASSWFQNNAQRAAGPSYWSSSFTAVTSIASSAPRRTVVGAFGRGRRSCISFHQVEKQLGALQVELADSWSEDVGFSFEEQLGQMHKLLRNGTIEPRVIQTVREVFLEAVRASYWEQLHQGRFVGSDSATKLLNSVSIAKELSGNSLADWSIVEQDLMHSSSVCKLRFLHLLNLAEGPKQQFEKQMKAIQTVNRFVEAHRHAQKQVADYFCQGPFLETPEQAFVILESQILVLKATKFLQFVPKPVQSQVNTMWEVQCLFEQYRQYVMSVHESGVLQAKEAEVLLHPVEALMREVAQNPQVFSEKLDRLWSNRYSAMDTLQSAVYIQRAARRWLASKQKRESHNSRNLPNLLAGGVSREVHRENVSICCKMEGHENNTTEDCDQQKIDVSTFTFTSTGHGVSWRARKENVTVEQDVVTVEPENEPENIMAI